MHYFITGTDTDCGKTYTTCQLLDMLNPNYSVQGLKPVASGCDTKEGRRESEDVRLLQAHNPNPQLAINGWSFAEPISPHLAALHENQQLKAVDIANFCKQEAFRAFDALLVEGAGGVMAPLNDTETWLDFLKLSEMPVILVVGLRLGCLNHALLTEAVLRSNNIPCCGWIANCCDTKMLAIDENIETLKKKMSIPFLATLEYGGKLPRIALPFMKHKK